jgi:hypothetical protein
VAWTQPKTDFSPGNVLTAAQMNAIGENLVTIGEAWTEYTPTVAGGTITLGTGGQNVARYIETDALVMVQGRVLFGTGGSAASGPITLSMPTAARTGFGALGQSLAYDASGSTYGLGTVELASGASVVNMRFMVAGGTIKGFGGNDPFIWAAGDALSWTIFYEAAS